MVLFNLKAMLSWQKPCDATIDFDMYQNLHRHCVDLPAIARLSCFDFGFVEPIYLSVVTTC